MGAYLSSPKTEKESNEGENERFKFGVSAMQGWRTSMEDAHSTVLNLTDDKGQPSTIGFFGVFDGHGGKEVAMFAAKYLTAELVRTEGWQRGNLEEAIQQAYMNLDSSLNREDTWEELSKFAKGNKSDEEEPHLTNGTEDPAFEDALRNAVFARFGTGIQGDSIYWEGDEFDDPPFDPMVALDESKAQDLSEMDIMTRGDSEEEEEDAEEGDPGTGDATGQDEEGGSESSADKASSASGSEEGGNINALSHASGEVYRGPSAGCTAVVALVANDLLVVANAGDSRCVASRGGKAHAMTNDHKPTDAVEAARIHKAGGWVTEGRVNGSLNLSRAFGDMEFKRTPKLSPAQQMITADPDVTTLKLTQGDEFLILACDGIWDVLTNQQAVDFVHEHLKKGMSPKAVCEAMCDRCLAPNAEGCGEGCDNMSAMVIVLKKFASPETLQPTPVPQPMPPVGP